jgi:polysaccharide chain length determinant protein (PEP-CTERM system associated)
MQDYVEILKRRFWLILTFAILLLGAGVGISYIIPPQYVSQTLVLVEQQKVPANYVTPVVTEDLGERLSSMSEQILSRSRLEPIITKFNLFASGQTTMDKLFAGGQTTMDERVEMTQKAIGIKPIQSTRGGMPGFYITFKTQDARTAQQVCGEITSLFISANLSAHEQSAEGTTEFLKQQLADAKRSLDDQDAKLAAFEQKYFGKLPSQEPSNANTLQALTTQLDAATQSLGRMQQNETLLQALITQQTQDLQHTESATGVSEDERKKELKALLAQKQGLQALYTPDYPDVVAISRKIADLQAEIDKVPAQSAPAKAAVNSGTAVVDSSDSPQLQQLKFQLRAVQQSIVDEKQEQARIQHEVRTYEAKIEASPQIEEEYKQVTRDHETALEFYNSLLKKMNESSMATALEQRQQGEQFRVMDAPNLPEEPTFPNRPLFACGGFAAGLMLGLLIAGLFEYRDISLRNERDIWAFTKLPTLAIIAYINDIPQLPPARSRWKLFSRTNEFIESTRG